MLTWIKQRPLAFSYTLRTFLCCGVYTPRHGFAHVKMKNYLMAGFFPKIFGISKGPGCTVYACHLARGYLPADDTGGLVHSVHAFCKLCHKRRSAHVIRHILSRC
jgi:hypothetical protein